MAGGSYEDEEFLSEWWKLEIAP